jgi:hypothetical protein
MLYQLSYLGMPAVLEGIDGPAGYSGDERPCLPGFAVAGYARRGLLAAFGWRGAALL